MRIGLYVYPSGYNGGERYIGHLLQALPRAGVGHDYFLYSENACRPPRLANVHLRARWLTDTGRGRWDRVQVEMPRWLRQDRIDVFHTHYHRFPLHRPCPTVVTLHDLIPLVSPAGTIQPARRRLLKHRLAVVIGLADHLIASSRYTAQLLLTKLHVDPRRVTQIYLGCPSQFYPMPREAAARRVRRLFRIGRPYLLSVGDLIPRKNHQLLIRAFRPRLARWYDLVIAGKLGWCGDRVLRVVGGDRTIHCLGAVTDEELRWLYAAAECLVYPSQEEGFGFPPLEAMACGTPVVALRCASLPEVVGDAGLLVEPGSPRRLADALERLLEDQALQERLHQRGLVRVRQFRWEETARQTLAVYRRVASR